MRSREYYWSLYHATEKNQLDNLRTDQVEAVFAALPRLMRLEWSIWREGFENWKPLEDFPQLLLSLRKVENQVVPLPPAPPAMAKGNPKASTPGTVMHTAVKSPGGQARTDTISEVVDLSEDYQKKFEMSEADDVDLSFEAVSAAEERNNFRFNKALDVRLMAGNQVWQNRTVNVSLRGMQLAHPLPSSLPRYFNVELTHRDQKIQMVCSIVKTVDGSASNRVKIEVNDFTPGLLAILLSA